jgi:hypothetical protein
MGPTFRGARLPEPDVAWSASHLGLTVPVRQGLRQCGHSWGIER